MPADCFLIQLDASDGGRLGEGNRTKEQSQSVHMY